MSFTDGAFFILAGVFMGLWPLVRGQDRPRWIAITVTSLVFYGWLEWRFLLLLGTGAVDFVAVLLM